MSRKRGGRAAPLHSDGKAGRGSNKDGQRRSGSKNKKGEVEAVSPRNTKTRSMSGMTNSPPQEETGGHVSLPTTPTTPTTRARAAAREQLLEEGKQHNADERKQKSRASSLPTTPTTPTTRARASAAALVLDEVKHHSTDERKQKGRAGSATDRTSGKRRQPDDDDVDPRGDGKKSVARVQHDASAKKKSPAVARAPNENDVGNDDDDNDDDDYIDNGDDVEDDDDVLDDDKYVDDDDDDDYDYDDDDGGKQNKKEVKEDFAHGHQLTKLGQNWMLDNLIKDEVFSRQKFAALDRDLMFSNQPNSICQFMAKKLEIKDDEVEQWWESTRKHVHTLVSKLRNNTIKGIKKLFQGKMTWTTTSAMLAM
jgi:hypothetical protein